MALEFWGKEEEALFTRFEQKIESGQRLTPQEQGQLRYLIEKVNNGRDFFRESGSDEVPWLNAPLSTGGFFAGRDNSLDVIHGMRRIITEEAGNPAPQWENVADYDRTHMLMNANEFISQSQREGNVPFVHPDLQLEGDGQGAVQSRETFDPFDYQSQIGSKFQSVYLRASAHVREAAKRDPELYAVMAKEQWTRADRDVWEKHLQKHVDEAMHFYALTGDYRKFGENTGQENLNAMDGNTAFVCHESHALRAVLMQGIENQALRGDTDTYRSPSNYYGMSNNWEQANGEGGVAPGGGHYVVVSGKTGNIFNWDRFINAAPSFAHVLAGNPIPDGNGGSITAWQPSDRTRIPLPSHDNDDYHAYAQQVTQSHGRPGINASAPEVGFFQRIGNFFSEAWDFYFGDEPETASQQAPVRKGPVAPKQAAANRIAFDPQSPSVSRSQNQASELQGEAGGPENKAKAHKNIDALVNGGHFDYKHHPAFSIEDKGTVYAKQIAQQHVEKRGAQLS